MQQALYRRAIQRACPHQGLRGIDMCPGMRGPFQQFNAFGALAHGRLHAARAGILIARELDRLTPETQPSALALQSVAQAVLEAASPLPAQSPWRSLRGLRANAPARATVLRLSDGRNDHIAELDAAVGPSALPVSLEADGWLVAERGASFVLTPARTDGGAHGPAASGTILSPMPGKIIAVDVVNGQAVTKGQKLVTLEAMKMEHGLTAPFDGTVADLEAKAGGQVNEGMVLLRIEPVE